MRDNKNFTRVIAAVIQAVIDVLIFRASFWLVTYFWLSGQTFPIFSREANIFFAGTLIAVFYFNSLYSFKTWLLWDEAKAILKSSILALLVAVLFLYSQNFKPSRVVVSFGVIVFIMLCTLTRYIFRRTLFALGLLSTNIIILGAGRTGEIFAERITHHPFTLAKVSGFLDDDEAKQGLTVAGYKVRGRLEDFTALYEQERIDEAAIAISKASRSLLTNILDAVEFRVRQVHYIPDMYLLTTFSSTVRDVDGIPIIFASQGLLNPVNRAVKYFADYVIALATLVILSPVMLYYALKVRRKYGGEIFSRQKRSGLGGKVFTLYRFRTLGHGDTGRRSRRAYVEALPQLLNVLRGEMSVVGPKPLTAEDMTHIYGEETAREISMVKPGITGFWQISIQEDDKKMYSAMNLYYIRNWSLWLDAVIFTKTVGGIFFRQPPQKNFPY